ncbi:MAG TPA: cation diffusion facilitator family transporter [Terriglobia bacterium]|nr:cation diffusion facilitator family transporter [Terriglobia bacterium]
MVHEHTHFHAAKGWLTVALIITAALVAVEFTAGSLAHSLSLISDGWHNLSDVPTLLFAALALHFERRSATEEKTFGYQRAGVLAAFVNALILIGISILICYEGYERLVRPQPVKSGVMMIVGVIALAVNGTITFGLSQGREDLNVRAVFLHNLGDALSNIAIIAGAWIIRVTGQRMVDPILAFLIAGMIVWSAIGILDESVNILLESLPKGMSVQNVARAMLEIEGVREVHDVHIWSLNPHSHALACHVRILDMPTSESERISENIRRMLSRDFGIDHCTVQFEHTHLPGEFHAYMPEPAPERQAKKE